MASPNPAVLLALLLGPGDGWLGVLLFDAAVPILAEVVPDSPAAAAGLRPGDVVLSLDGEVLSGVEAFAHGLARRSAGEEVRLRIRRGEEELDVAARLAERPSRQAAEPGVSGGVARPWTQACALRASPHNPGPLHVGATLTP